MKIVQINGSYGTADSTGRTTKEMHTWLRLHGQQSYVFAAEINDNKALDPGVELYSTPFLRKIHSVASRISGLQGYFSWIDTKKLIFALEKIRPNVVVLRVLHNNSLHFPLFMRYLAKKKIAAVLVLHDCWYYTGHCCYYIEENCGLWMQQCGNCPAIHKWNKSWFFDTSQKLLKDKRKWFSSIENLGVVGVSDWITGEAKRSAVLGDVKEIEAIYNWIDQTVFCPRDKKTLREELGLPIQDQIAVAVASTWSDVKGLQEILMIAEKQPELTIVLIGNTDARDWPTNIVRTGAIQDSEKLAKYYAAADVFLNPSIQETFGKTTAEALSCGIPVVAYETTACTELVGRDGSRGKLVPLKDRQMFLEKTEALLSQKDVQYDCISFAHSNFSMEKNMQKYMKLFYKLTHL